MRTLADAWSWYQENKKLLRLMGRLGRRHWNQMPWDRMEKDDNFRHLDGADVGRTAENILAELDDIAVFVLFSVFEARVREHVLGDVKSEAAKLKHPALVKMVSRMKENIEEGSFYKNVLDLFKDLDHDMVEEVSQIRSYRNWVAHGRRPGKKPRNTSPKEAFDGLSAFLTLIDVDGKWA